MRSQEFSVGLTAVLIIFCVALLMTARAAAQTETVLYSFNITDGELPYAGLVFGKNGSLYGTTVDGGTYSYGTVFELSPAAGGGWTETVLHNFGQGKDGSLPIGGLIFDKVGHLYGTTEYGGTGPCKVVLSGCGTVFELSPGSGGWSYKEIYPLPGNGWGAYERLVMDGGGNLYGTLFEGTYSGYGSVFKLTPSNGGWTYTSLHDFTDGDDGANPYGGLVLDSNGNLYGTTEAGGAFGYGAVFEITP